MTEAQLSLAAGNLADWHATSVGAFGCRSLRWPGGWATDGDVPPIFLQAIVLPGGLPAAEQVERLQAVFAGRPAARGWPLSTIATTWTCSHSAWCLCRGGPASGGQPTTATPATAAGTRDSGSAQPGLVVGVRAGQRRRLRGSAPARRLAPARRAAGPALPGVARTRRRPVRRRRDGLRRRRSSWRLRRGGGAVRSTARLRRRAHVAGDAGRTGSARRTPAERCSPRRLPGPGYEPIGEFTRWHRRANKSQRCAMTAPTPRVSGYTQHVHGTDDPW